MDKLSAIKAVLIDLSGTIHVENQAIKGELNSRSRFLKEMTASNLFHSPFPSLTGREYRGDRATKENADQVHIRHEHYQGEQGQSVGQAEQARLPVATA